MRWASLLLAVPFGACGDNAIPHAPFEARSGSRLALRWITFDDGTRQWDPIQFQDLERVELCKVQRWSDGFTYCTPTAMPTVYRDMACTQELGRWLATQPAPTYFYREFSLLGFEVISKIYHRSDAAAVPDTTYELHDGNCVATSNVGWNYFQLGTEVPRDDFVRVKQLFAVGTERLGLDVYTSDDGLYVPVETDRPVLRDRVLDGECRVLEHANTTTTVCEPTAIGEARFSRDPECATANLLVTDPGDTIPSVVTTDVDGCKTYARRTAEISISNVFLPLSGACVAVNLPADAHVFEIGEPYDIPILARQHEPTPNRLQRILLTDGVTTVVDSLLFDRDLGVDCARTRYPDDTFRCLPLNGLSQVFPYFSDDQCLTPLDIAFVEIGACDPQTRFAFDRRGPEPTVRPLIAPYELPIYEISTADSCLEYKPPGRERAYTVGPVMAPNEFVGARFLIGD